ncbi:HAD family hydrolase [Halarcobacter ebronensis]|uniref:phosphoglycolate phosphatase n=1 Tax=Halarcobacter ebronensis TaxID=1462615 RepID=A0A4Q0YA66_9BACT|nr:HAD family hydrolase [Halarcobacter ebronensis]RXJ65919.1 HAD family hydrolase [Halarcobacter ebronensis]
MKAKAVIFDMDGTILNSLEDIAISSNIVLKEFNFPTHKIEDYKNFVGGGVQILLDNCTPKDISQELYKKVFERFKEVYENNVHNRTKPYEGIYELLKELKRREIKMGILSNKMHDFTLKYYEKFFMDFNMQEVHGQKSHIPKKPDPMGATLIAKSFNLEPSQILFVGDSDVDMQTAKAAGMISVGVAWGFRGIEELIEHGANHIVKTPIDILNLLE